VNVQRRIKGEEDAVTTAPIAAAPPERVIVNTVSGERIVIRTSGTETGGQLLIFDLFLPPTAHVPARHAHPTQTEQFTVLAGQMRFVLGRQSMLAVPGDTVLVRPSTPHWFENAGPGTAHARVEVRPALRMEELLAASAALAVPGRLFGGRLPRLSDLALLLQEFQGEVAIPHLPAVLARAMIAPLDWIGRHRASRVAP